MSGDGKAWSSPPGCVYAGGVADKRMWAPVCILWVNAHLSCRSSPLAPALPLLPAFTARRIESRHLAQIEHPAFSGCPPAYPDHTDRLYHVTPSRLCPLPPLPWNLPSVSFLWTITHPPPLQSSRPLLMVPPWQNWPFPVAGTHLTLPRSPASGFCFFEA